MAWFSYDEQGGAKGSWGTYLSQRPETREQAKRGRSEWAGWMSRVREARGDEDGACWSGVGGLFSALVSDLDAGCTVGRPSAAGAPASGDPMTVVVTAVAGTRSLVLQMER